MIACGVGQGMDFGHFSVVKRFLSRHQMNSEELKSLPL